MLPIISKWIGLNPVLGSQDMHILLKINRYDDEVKQAVVSIDQSHYRPSIDHKSTRRHCLETKPINRSH